MLVDKVESSPETETSRKVIHEAINFFNLGARIFALALELIQRLAGCEVLLSIETRRSKYRRTSATQRGVPG
jgi:hypothetical protein